MVHLNESLAQTLAETHWFQCSIFLIYHRNSKEHIIFRRLNAQTRAMCFEKSPSLAHLFCVYNHNVFVDGMTAANSLEL